MLMDFDKTHRLEIAALKRQLKRAERHIKALEKISQVRRQAYISIRDDVYYFFRQWLECQTLAGSTWHTRSVAQKLWYNYCAEILPLSDNNLAQKMGQSQLVEKGTAPKITTPED